MIEALVDLWEEPCDARCITTNGFVKNNGRLVMGAGVAGQAQSKYPDLPKHWGNRVKLEGNHVLIDILSDDSIFFTFPVKHKWFEKAELELIERSAKELVVYLDKYAFLQKVLLPLPGCGNGQLSWADVKPVIAPILDDRVWAINNRLTADFNPTPKSWWNEACPSCKGYPDPVCTCSDEVKARRKERNA
jgi:hypothetical protein